VLDVQVDREEHHANVEPSIHTGWNAIH
jgi:hypothetical protein